MIEPEVPFLILPTQHCYDGIEVRGDEVQRPDGQSHHSPTDRHMTLADAHTTIQEIFETLLGE